MATTVVEWKNLPADILSKLAKLLNTDVDNLRLRSVCSSWRSSLPLPNKPLSFPLKLPPIVLPCDFPLNPLFYGHFADAEVAGDFVLDEITFYRISPPSSDENSSNGWLLKVSSPTNSNSSSFTLLNPVTMEKMEDPIPKRINLLDYRVAEICKSHKGNFSGDPPLMTRQSKKIIALWDYFRDCDFAVLCLDYSGTMIVWKIGGENWTPINSRFIDDVILFHGKFYAVNDGVLLFLDCDFNLTTVVVSTQMGSGEYLNLCHVFLVECESDLYVVSYIGYDAEQFDDDDEVYQTPSRLMFTKFNECGGSLDPVEDLPVDVFFILSAYASSHCFNAKDFAGFKGNRVYVLGECFALEVEHGVKPKGPDITDGWVDCQNMVGVYHSEDSGKEISPPSWFPV